MRPTSLRRSILGAAVCGAALAFPARAAAQSNLEDVLEQFGAYSIQGYLQPFADLSGGNMHSGYYHTARIPSKMSFSISIVGMAASIGDDQKTFTDSTPPGFSPATFETATIFGGQGATVTDSSNPSLTYKGTDGFVNSDWWPSAIPQLNLAVGGGTEAILRLAVVPRIGDFPGSTLWGLGVRHDVGRYLGLPLDVAAGLFYSNWKAGDILDLKGLSLSAQASKDFSAVTLYGGLAYESATLNVQYTSTNPSAPGNVNLDLEGEQAFRFTGGAALRLGFFQLFADANFGAATTFSGGFSLGY